MSAAQALTPEEQTALATSAYYLFVSKYYALASTVMLYYDSVLTLDREVEAIWRSKWSSVKVLYFFNRYANIVAYTASIIEQLLTQPGLRICGRYVYFPGIFNLVQQTVIGAVLLLFTWALFNRDRRIVALVSITLIAQLVITGWSLSAVTYVPLPPGFVGCIYAGKAGTGIRVQTSWFMQLAFISVVFGLMIWKAASLQRFKKMKAPLITVLTRDGLKYFGIIFSVNFVNVMNFTLVKNDALKSIHATFSALLTVIMINRLILGVREETRKNAEGSVTESMMASPSLVVFTMETQTVDNYAVVETYEMPNRYQHHVDLVSVDSMNKKHYVVV